MAGGNLIKAQIDSLMLDKIELELIDRCWLPFIINNIFPCSLICPTIKNNQTRFILYNEIMNMFGPLRFPFFLVCAAFHIFKQFSPLIVIPCFLRGGIFLGALL